MIRLLLVDDHAAIRQGLRFLLEQNADIRVIGEAGSGREARSATLRLQPDLILLDLRLPDATPEELCPELRELSQHSKILILSGVEDADPVYRAIDAGIDGYALKASDSAELVIAIRQVMTGNSYLHPTITRLILHRAGKARTSDKHPHTTSPNLTKRQHQVLMLMACTATNRDIAKRLVVSEETVRSHVKGVLRKLGQSNRTQAVLEAVRLGIIKV
ncbi:MAG: response regulator [Candidatus Promineifilaceae bacterium]